MRKTRPSKKEIVSANATFIEEVLQPKHNEALEEYEHFCWACGEATRLERAHVQAVAHGGSHEPENFFLLCAYCHDEQPDGQPRDAQVRWLLSRPSFFLLFLRRGEEIWAAVRAATAASDDQLMRWQVDRQASPNYFDRLDVHSAASSIRTVRPNLVAAWARDFTSWMSAKGELQGLAEVHQLMLTLIKTSDNA